MRRTLRLQGRIPKYLPHILPAARPVKLRRVPYFWAAGRGETILKPAPPNSLYPLDAVFMGQGHLVPTTTDTGGGGGRVVSGLSGERVKSGGGGQPEPAREPSPAALRRRRNPPPPAPTQTQHCRCLGAWF